MPESRQLECELPAQAASASGSCARSEEDSRRDFRERLCRRRKSQSRQGAALPKPRSSMSPAPPGVSGRPFGPDRRRAGYHSMPHRESLSDGPKDRSCPAAAARNCSSRCDRRPLCALRPCRHCEARPSLRARDAPVSSATLPRIDPVALEARQAVVSRATTRRRPI